VIIESEGAMLERQEARQLEAANSRSSLGGSLTHTFALPFLALRAMSAKRRAPASTTMVPTQDTLVDASLMDWRASCQQYLSCCTVPFFPVLDASGKKALLKLFPSNIQLVRLLQAPARSAASMGSKHEEELCRISLSSIFFVSIPVQEYRDGMPVSSDLIIHSDSAEEPDLW
jgi:hypothetical protein